MLGRLRHALHVPGAVLEVGGMAFAPRPTLAEWEPPARLALHEGAPRRFFLVVRHAMPALLFFRYGGFRGAGRHIHPTHGTGLAMAGVVAALSLGPWRALRAARTAGDPPAAAGDADRVRRLVLVNFALGPPTVAVAARGRFGG